MKSVPPRQKGAHGARKVRERSMKHPVERENALNTFALSCNIELLQKDIKNSGNPHNC